MTMAVPLGPYWAEIGRRIRHARVGAGLTQGELAGAVGYTRTSIVNVEAGRQVVDALRLALIAKATGTTCDALASVLEPATPPVG
jgi:transcriptional regulator with XRE-family HTH domain